MFRGEKLKLNINKVDQRGYNITKEKGVDVEGITVNKILNNISKNSRPFLIKIDIEGYELNYLKIILNGLIF